MSSVIQKISNNPCNTFLIALTITGVILLIVGMLQCNSMPHPSFQLRHVISNHCNIAGGVLILVDLIILGVKSFRKAPPYLQDNPGPKSHVIKLLYKSDDGKVSIQLLQLLQGEVKYGLALHFEGQPSRYTVLASMKDHKRYMQYPAHHQHFYINQKGLLVLQSEHQVAIDQNHKDFAAYVRGDKRL